MRAEDLMNTSLALIDELKDIEEKEYSLEIEDKLIPKICDLRKKCVSFYLECEDLQDKINEYKEKVVSIKPTNEYFRTINDELFVEQIEFDKLITSLKEKYENITKEAESSKEKIKQPLKPLNSEKVQQKNWSWEIGIAILALIILATLIFILVIRKAKKGH